MANASDSNIISKSVFETGVDDKTQVVDVYKQTNVEPVNSIQDETPASAINLKNAVVRGSKVLKAAMPTVLSVLRDGSLLKNATSGSDRILAALRLSGTSFNILPDDLKKKLLDNPDDAKTILMKTGNITTRIASTNFSNARSLLSLTGDLSGNQDLAEYTDMGSELSIFSTAAKEASRLRMPTTFEQLASQLSGSQTLTKFTKLTLDDVVGYSDTASLLYLATHNSNGTIKQLNNNTICDFSTNYVSPLDATDASRSDEYNAVKNAFNAVDGQWLNTSTSVLDLSQINNPSSDMSKVITAGYTNASTGSSDQDLAYTSIDNKNLTVLNALKAQYPTTVYSQ